MTGFDDNRWMDLALREAEKAYEAGEVPVGAVIVHNERVIGRGYNRIEALQDATAHAEIIAIGAASETMGTWRLNGATLYATLEPCMMCAGAIRLARLDRVVFGAYDPQAGVFGSCYNVTDDGFVPVAVTPQIRADRSRDLLQTFFRQVRKKRGGDAPAD